MGSPVSSSTRRSRATPSSLSGSSSDRALGRRCFADDRKSLAARSAVFCGHADAFDSFLYFSRIFSTLSIQSGHLSGGGLSETTCRASSRRNFCSWLSRGHCCASSPREKKGSIGVLFLCDDCSTPAIACPHADQFVA